MLRRHAKWKLTFLIVLFYMQVGSSEVITPMGSILFEDHGFAKKCFIQSDIALLSTRLKFQDLLPVQREMLDDNGVTAIIRYFYGINEIIEKLGEDEVRQLVQKSFYDMLGSFLKHQVLPTAKFSFYSGNVTYSVVENLLNLYEHCKELLDTNGNGWAEPIKDFSEFAINIEPLNMKEMASEDDAMKACGNLAINQNDDNSEEDMIVALPKLESEENEDLSTIWLPLKRKHIFNINSPASSFILLRYFVMVSQCYNYQNINQAVFNKKFKAWVEENVLPYLEDEKLYPAFGAVLRILETIKDEKDDAYHGTKNTMMAKHHSLFGKMIRQGDDDSFFGSIPERDNIDWWIKIGFFALGGLAVCLLFIILLVRLIKKCRKSDSDDQSKYLSRKPSFWQRFKKTFRFHRPEADEYYQYRKVSNHGQRVAFENEKRKSRKQKKGKEKISLPFLHGHESDEEVELFSTTLGSSTSSVNSEKKKDANKKKFKISESSDEGSTKIKPSKSSMKNPQSYKEKPGLLEKMRLKSPQRRGK